MAEVQIPRPDIEGRDLSGKAVKSACYAPFVSLFFTTTGNVLACCRNETFLLGNVATQSLSEIWRGGRIHELRKALMDNRFDKGCEYCEWEIRAGNDRTAFRSLFDPFPILSEQPEWPAVIDFVGSNTCNFECIMCWGELSSSIRANRQGLPPLPKPYGERFFTELQPFLPHLHWMNFIGGEPFLSAEVQRIWQMIIDSDLTVPCHVTTNGSQYNAKVERILDALNMNITISLDGVTKETFEKIRRRSNFETVIANVNRFRAYTKQRGTSFTLAFCLMRQNWWEFGDMLLFGDRLGCDVRLNTVIDPSHCSLFTLPPRELRKIVERMEKQGADLTGQLGRNRAVWDESLQKLRAAVEEPQITRLETVLNAQSLRDDPLVAARSLAASGDYEKALAKLAGIGESHADRYFALALSGDIRGLAGDAAGAEADLGAAQRISQKLPQASISLARLRFRQGRIEEALQHARQAQAIVVPEEPLEFQLVALLAVIQTRRWRIAEAYGALARLIDLPLSAREGQAKPAADAGLRQMLAELLTKAPRLRSRILASLVWAQFHVARAFARFRSGPDLAVAPSADGPAAGGLVHIDIASFDETPRAAGLPEWSIRAAGANRARLVFPSDDAETARVAIQRTEGDTAHDIQLNRTAIALVADRSYLLAFRIRADARRTVAFGIAKADAPWSNLGLYRTLSIGDQWIDVREEFLARESEENGRVHFDLGGNGSSLEIGSFVFTETVGTQ